MNATTALALLAVLGFVVAGCGSSIRADSAAGAVTVTGTTTIANVAVGTLIRCKGGPAARTPHWFGSSYLRLPGVPGLMQLTHKHSGSVVVSCRR